jgi:beta-lactamase class A
MQPGLTFAIFALLQPSPGTLAGQFTGAAAASGGRVGVSVALIESGERDGLNQAERFPMQSVYKVPIAMAVLDLVDHKSLTLRQKVTLTAKDMAPAEFHSPLREAHPLGGIDLTVQDLIRAAIVESDGVASDVLLKLAGGPPRVTAYLRGLGIPDMTVATSELEMSRDAAAQYRNYSTPDAAIALMRALFAGRGGSASFRDMLLQYMVDSTPGPKRLKGLLPAGTIVAHKTGTDATRNGVTAATNDVGIITLPDGRHLAIAVFVKDSTASQDAREATIAKTARAAFDRWSGR